MSDLISREALIDVIEKQKIDNDAYCRLCIDSMKELIEEQPSVTDTNVGGKWIPCGERLPEERESIFKKAKGTDKWDPEMFESISDDVNVTVEFEDGTRKTMTSYTTDGKWSCEKEYRIKMKVIAWMPLPEPYKGE